MGCTGKCGCPPKFVSMIKSLHNDIKASVNFGGALFEQGVKQEDLSAPTLFAIYFAVMLAYAFKDLTEGTLQIYWFSLDLRRLRNNPRVFAAVNRDLFSMLMTVI